MHDIADFRCLLEKSEVKPNADVYTRQIDRIFSGYDNICVFGMGTYAEDILPYLKTHIGSKIVCVSDNDPAKWNKEYCGYRCVPPDELLSCQKELSILVSVVDARSVIDELKSKGCMRIINENRDEHILQLIFRRIKALTLYKENRSSLEQVFSLLSDDCSRDVFYTILNYNLNPLDFDFMNNPLSGAYTPDQYFPEDIISLNGNEVFVDGGGYIGDTINLFRNKTKDSFDKIYSFELEGDNFEKLHVYLEGLHEEIRAKIRIYRLGLWDRADTLGIHGKTWGAHISDSGFSDGPHMEVDSLDNVLGEDARVTYIKLDVEGSEKRALLGAKKIIEKNRSKLAVCVYHRLEDLYELPLLIHKLSPQYKLFFRHHTTNTAETVCYAT